MNPKTNDMAYFLKNISLTEQQKELLELRLKLYKVEKDKEKIVLEKQNEILQKEMQKEILERKNEMLKKEIIIKFLEKESKIKLLEKESSIKLLEKESSIKLLEERLSHVNWDLFKLNESLIPRSVQEFFEKQCFRFDPKDKINRIDKYKLYIEQNSNKLPILEEWNFTTTSFAQCATDMFKRLSSVYAHPNFKDGDIVCIPSEVLNNSEWRVLGVLWKLIPLRPNSLVKCKNDGNRIIIECLKDLKD